MGESDAQALLYSEAIAVMAVKTLEGPHATARRPSRMTGDTHMSSSAPWSSIVTPCDLHCGSKEFTHNQCGLFVVHTPTVNR